MSGEVADIPFSTMGSMTTNNTPQIQGPLCSYCGRRVRRGTKPKVAKSWCVDGSDWVGHRACWLELRYPDDPKVGHARHDIH